MNNREAERIAAQIRLNKDIPKVRTELADLIRRELDRRHADLGIWEKMYFAQSVRSLHHNLENTPQPNNHWLMLSLVNLHKACVPSEARNEDYVKSDDFSWLTYDMISQSLSMTGVESKPK